MADFINTENPDNILGSPGDDTFAIPTGESGAGNDNFVGGAGFDTAFGGVGNDDLFGGTDGDELHGGEGDDRLHGGAGFDRFHIGLGTDNIFGGDDLDVVVLSEAIDGWTVDLATGRAGTTRLNGIEAVTATQFDDSLFGSSGNDELSGMTANDLIQGRGGNDFILADDRSLVDLGNDRVFGGRGADYIESSGGNDRLFGGRGTDSLGLFVEADVALRLGAVVRTVNLGTDGTMRIGGFEDIITADGNDTIQGSGRANKIETNDGDDQLSGGGGNDSLIGGTGNDRLFGGGGADTLFGGADRDTLTGGDGIDTFRFINAGHSTAADPDRITDFNVIDEAIDLRGMIVVIDTEGNTREAEFTFINGDTFSGTQDELRFEAGQLQGDTDNDGLADFVILLDGVSSFGSGNLVL